MLLVKVPVPVPSVVCALLMVGFWEVLQHTPRAVTEAPPSLLIVPPETALLLLIEEIPAVVREGGITAAEVVKLIWLP